MTGKDNIKDLFSDKLGGFEAKVNPQLWGNIASQVGAGSTAAATGFSLITKLIIGVSAASIITVGAIVLTNSSKDDERDITPAKKEQSRLVAQDKDVTDPIEKKKPEETNAIIVNTPALSGSQASLPLSINPTRKAPFVSSPPSLPIRVVKNIAQEDEPVLVVWKEQAVQQSTKAPDKNDPVLESSQDIISEESKEIEIVFPNIFTPNGDGANDELFIENTEGLSGFHISVLNQEYETVYESNDPKFRWSGEHIVSGERLKEGIYIALISSKVTTNGEEKEAKPVMYQFTIKR